MEQRLKSVISNNEENRERERPGERDRLEREDRRSAEAKGLKERRELSPSGAAAFFSSAPSLPPFSSRSFLFPLPNTTHANSNQQFTVFSHKPNKEMETKTKETGLNGKERKGEEKNGKEINFLFQASLMSLVIIRGERDTLRAKG